MKALIVLVAIFSLWLDLSCGNPNKEANHYRTPSQFEMDSVLEADRPQFVAYHISLGLNERQRNDVTFFPRLETISSEKREAFNKIETPLNFSVNLLDWTELELVPKKNGHIKDSYGIANDAGMMEVCFPSGCVDPNDAGSLCCPF
jgi:hypothetical protein